MSDVSRDMSECVAAIIRILRSEFQVNPVFGGSVGRANITFSVSGEQYRVYLADHFEEQYAAAPQTGINFECLAGQTEGLFNRNTLSSGFAFRDHCVAQLVRFLMR